MTFYSDFSDISYKKYSIEIHSDNNDASEITLTMGGNPVTISASSEGLLSPIKSRSCSLDIVTTAWYFDLYEPTSRGTSVKIFETDTPSNVIFFGYLTPCSYDQTWTYMDVITLEAVDALSTCKDFKWVHNNKYNSFLEIILPILKQAGYKGNLYVPRTYSKVNDTTLVNDCLSSLYASSGNFIDDDEAHTPWTHYEVLTEICKFLGWSMIPYGHDVWLVDYKAESLGQVTYSTYDIQTYEQGNSVTSDLTGTAITLDNEAGGTANISIDNIYNKIEISDNLYNIESIAPDIFADENHISVTDEKEMGADKSKWTSVRRKRFLFWEWDSSKEALEGTDYQTLCRLKDSSGWTHKYYRHSDLQPVNNDNGEGYYDATTAADSRQTPYTKSKENQYCNTHGCLLQHYAYVDESHPNNVPATIDWTDILTFFVLGPTSPAYYLTAEGQTGSILSLQKDVLEYNIAEEIQWKPASGTSWITIKGDLFYQNSTDYKDGKKKRRLTINNLNEYWYATCPVDKSMSSLPSDLRYLEVSRSPNETAYGNGFNMWKMKLQIGTGANARWWNSDTEKWQTTECYFYIPFNNNPDNENDEFIPAFTWVNTVNNKNFKDRVGVDAYAIPIPSDTDDPFHTYGDAPSRGSLKLTLCTPALCCPEFIAKYGRVFGNLPLGFGSLPPVIYCKDFEVGFVYTDTDVWYNAHDDNNNNDKVYIGYINENFIQDFDDMELKLNTAVQDKPVSKSYVSAADGAYLKTMFHTSRAAANVQEYNLVDLYLDHHSERKPIFEVNMHGLPTPNTKYLKTNISNDVYMIDSYTFDVARTNNRLKLIAF